MDLFTVDSDSESNSSSSSSEDDDSTSDPEPETELQILGKITSKGTEQRREKKKKVKTKEKLAALHQEEVSHTCILLYLILFVEKIYLNEGVN